MEAVTARHGAPPKHVSMGWIPVAAVVLVLWLYAVELVPILRDIFAPFLFIPNLWTYLIAFVELVLIVILTGLLLTAEKEVLTGGGAVTVAADTEAHGGSSGDEVMEVQAEYVEPAGQSGAAAAERDTGTYEYPLPEEAEPAPFLAFDRKKGRNGRARLLERQSPGAFYCDASVPVGGGTKVRLRFHAGYIEDEV